jgi:metal-responsive CopG/Arc/MetJ family transcriptional regulator
MTQINLQVRIPTELDAALDEACDGNKSRFVRAAIEEKIARERARRLEQQWIDALVASPQPEEEAWLEAESWGPT